MKELTEGQKQEIEQLQLNIDWIKEGGFQLQYWSDEMWKDCGCNTIWGCKGVKLRRKPQPIEVPLEFDDIDLHRDLFKHKKGSGEVKSIAFEANINHVSIANLYPCTYQQLMDNYLRSIDGGKTWQACSKTKTN